MADGTQILPGTYITVRDEGLISVGGVSTGNIGIVGTAVEGAINTVYTLSSLTEAKELFAPHPQQTYPNAETVTLLKALELLFANGASTVYAVQAESEMAEHYSTALALLENELINIVLLAGQDASQTAMATAIMAHLAATETQHRERLAVIGSNGTTDVEQIIAAKTPVVHDQGRVIYVAPGVHVTKRDPATGQETTTTLSGAYTAAAVAGLLSSLPVQVSPTNKTINISALATRFKHGQLEKLVQAKVLAIEQREGFRVVKGLTTSANVAWQQITTRRIVDYAIYGVRAACNPYIGKLNNERVRGAMKATLDGFLTRMVENEALTGYQLTVSATRAQEIAGQAIVTMTIQPTFSIDYIAVTMSLG